MRRLAPLLAFVPFGLFVIDCGSDSTAPATTGNENTQSTAGRASGTGGAPSASAGTGTAASGKGGVAASAGGSTGGSPTTATGGSAGTVGVGTTGGSAGQALVGQGGASLGGSGNAGTSSGATAGAAPGGGGAPVGAGGSAAGSVGAAGTGSAGTPGAAGAASACPGVTTGSTFKQVQAIFAKSCATTMCHPSSMDGSHIDLHNTDGMLHARLLATVSNTKAECKNHTIVVPCKPEESFIMAMIGTDDAARMKCGGRMPDDCAKNNKCLSDADMETIRSWIAVGAPE